MRWTLPVALAALLAPAALAGTGPYAGALAQGETATHEFDNHPADGACIQLATTWTVTLAYAPPTDVLTLQVGALTAVGANGVASVSFAAGVCTAFAMRVTGTSVDALAAYTLHTRSLVANPVVEWA